jgi:type II secretory pathway component PulM
MAGGQHTKFDGHAVDAQAQQGAAELVGLLAPLCAHGAKAMAQHHPRGLREQAQRLVRKALGAKALNSFKVVLAQGEQAQVALEDVAVGDGTTNRGTSG